MVNNAVAELKPAADGSYPVVLGRIGKTKSGGRIYKPLSDALIAKVVERSKQGIYSEFGHPSLANRLVTGAEKIYESLNPNKTAAVLHDINVTTADGEQVITGRMTPSGVYGQQLAEFISKGAGNLVFGMRALGQMGPDTVTFEVSAVITWDLIHMGV